MIKTGLRILCFMLLCTLLVYAPEIYATVSTQYAIRQPRRVLLRISLCAQDAASEEALLSALQIYMKESPSIHLRITSPTADELFSQPDPQPDLFIFPVHLPAPLSAFRRKAENGQLLFAVHKNTRDAEAADALLSYLLAVSGLDSITDSGL